VSGGWAGLSKAVSHALRHEPWLYELELDDAGWTSVDALVEALSQESRWRGLSRAQLETMIERAPKQRHEIDGSRIRALYGHSVPGRIVKTPGVPPRCVVPWDSGRLGPRDPRRRAVPDAAAVRALVGKPGLCLLRWAP